MKVKLSGVRKIAVTGEFIKLDSLLKLASVTGTGGEAKQVIASGDVRVNGEACTMRGKKLRDGDVVTCLGQTLIVAKRGESP